MVETTTSKDVITNHTLYYKSNAKDAPHENVFIHSPLALLCDGCKL